MSEVVGEQGGEEQKFVETTMGSAGKCGSCTSGPASACSRTSSSLEIWGHGEIVANIVPFAAGVAVADLPREQLRARAQKRLDDYVGTIPSKHVRLRDENGVLSQLGRGFLDGVLQEGLAREESRRTVAQLNKVSKRTAVPRPLGTENKALLNAQQTYSCRPWGRRPESEPVLLRSPGQTSHRVLHEKEYSKELPGEVQEWTFILSKNVPPMIQHRRQDHMAVHYTSQELHVFVLTVLREKFASLVV